MGEMASTAGIEPPRLPGSEETGSLVTPRSQLPYTKQTDNSYITLQLEPAFGWVLLVLLLSVALFIFFAVNVIRARVRFGVRPPDTYAVKGITGRGGDLSDDGETTLLRLSAKECDIFNCYQRAHQHAVELYTIFIPTLLMGGAGFPLASAIGGLVFLCGTLVYGLGYYTGEAVNRKWGSFQVVGLLICSMTTFLQAIRLLWSG